MRLVSSEAPGPMTSETLKRKGMLCFPVARLLLGTELHVPVGSFVCSGFMRGASPSPCSVWTPSIWGHLG